MLSAVELTRMWPQQKTASSWSKQQILKEFKSGPMTFIEAQEKLQCLKKETLRKNLADLCSLGIMHSGYGKGRYYALIGQKLPKKPIAIGKGLATDMLRQLETHGPLLIDEIYKLNPNSPHKSISNALYRLRGRVKGYGKKIILSTKGYYRLKP